MSEFKSWPKIPRWENEEFTITEKLDGTNACVIVKVGLMSDEPEFYVGAQSRTRVITPDDDNFDFARWVYENAEELTKLGAGHHYGEWVGKGIQRTYGLDERRFYLFEPWKAQEIPDCCHIVPTLTNIKPYDTVELTRESLFPEGSLIAPGFMRVEGVIIQAKHGGQRYKIIWDK